MTKAPAFLHKTGSGGAGRQLNNAAGVYGTDRKMRAVPPRFDDLMTPTKDRHEDRIQLVIEVARDICILLALAALMYLPLLNAANAHSEAEQSQNVADEMAHWPEGMIAKQYHAAQQYNKGIAATGQQRMGETIDPFISYGSGHKTLSEEDKTYQSLLNARGGAMGSIRIPKISLNLPIFHGTSKAVLQEGVGHLYGTSVPVGGTSTNSVLAGHRGLPNALMFTRLDELRRGDFIYIDTLNRTMGYRVKAIHVIDPNDTHLYKVVPGKDLITLMTCTPYGINTQRLIITAERAPIPEHVPGFDRRDAVFDGLAVAAVVLLLGVLAVMVGGSRSFVLPPWHSADGSAQGSRLAGLIGRVRTDKGRLG